MLHEFITCDRCNEDGEIDVDLIGSLDDGDRFQISGNAEAALAHGWLIDDDLPHDAHVCPECQEEQPGDREA